MPVAVVVEDLDVSGGHGWVPRRTARPLSDILSPPTTSYAASASQAGRDLRSFASGTVRNLGAPLLGAAPVAVSASLGDDAVLVGEGLRQVGHQTELADRAELLAYAALGQRFGLPTGLAAQSAEVGLAGLLIGRLGLGLFPAPVCAVAASGPARLGGQLHGEYLLHGLALPARSYCSSWALASAFRILASPSSRSLSILALPMAKSIASSLGALAIAYSSSRKPAWILTAPLLIARQMLDAQRKDGRRAGSVHGICVGQSTHGIGGLVVGCLRQRFTRCLQVVGLWTLLARRP